MRPGFLRQRARLMSDGMGPRFLRRARITTVIWVGRVLPLMSRSAPWPG